LLGLAQVLGALEVPGVSREERVLLSQAEAPPASAVARVRDEIAAGLDPLGHALCQLRSPSERRLLGATYTPQPIVQSMLAWASANGQPARVVDPGAGSGRFLLGAAQVFPGAQLVAMEIDPLPALLLRAQVAALGLAQRTVVFTCDYRANQPPRIDGPTLYLGNPPYVRHHAIDPAWKRWFSRTAREHGLAASQRAGLHVHFFLATALQAAPGDYGAFVTAAEWLDVNYGALLRDLFLGPLGGTEVHILEPTARPFPDAATTAAITCFAVGRKTTTVRMARHATLAALGSLGRGRLVARARLESASRWTPLTRPSRSTPRDFVELGELCRVSRGQVTGCNGCFVLGPGDDLALPGDVLFPAVTRARELLRLDGVLVDATALRRVVDLPVDLDAFPREYRGALRVFLARARARGVDRGYIARHRKAWWAVGLYEPAPILATYMARRAPAFVHNRAAVRHLNIAHGIYPRQPLTLAQLVALTHHLATTTKVGDGRTYAGGLTKFEPKEMERLLVPRPSALLAGRASAP
jgi:hypothetical protein